MRASRRALSSASGLSGTAAAQNSPPLPCVDVRLPRPDQSRLVDRLVRPAPGQNPPSELVRQHACQTTEAQRSAWLGLWTLGHESQAWARSMIVTGSVITFPTVDLTETWVHSSFVQEQAHGAHLRGGTRPLPALAASGEGLAAAGGYPAPR